MKNKLMKITALLTVLLMAVALCSCQQKTINVELNFTDASGGQGGMNAAVPEKSTLKDLFDAYDQIDTFTYELDSEGYIVSINGRENDESGRWAICKQIDGIDDPINDIIANIPLADGDVYTITYIPNEDLLGGWQLAEVSRTELTEEEETAFNSAMEALIGEAYEPVQVLATQVVNGTNLAYLARGYVAGKPELPDWYVVRIYESLDGEARLDSIYQIDVNEIHTVQDNNEDLLGGWQVKTTGKPGSMGSAEAQASFDKAVAELDGVRYNPIQLLATQLVAGTNYRALVYGDVVGNEEHNGLYVITWYEDLEGNSMVTDISAFDLLTYVS